ncbi:coil containing protein [Vibrio phage 1.115.B._10N.222.49.B11]|nr:coil containing protein [Vibrio phage 1.115.A._10N.222.49.B11]AUR88617.1 coil containing protein [Vibrio phage 1.115.B._10N.222.49.B11]
MNNEAEKKVRQAEILINDAIKLLTDELRTNIEIDIIEERYIGELNKKVKITLYSESKLNYS